MERGVRLFTASSHSRPVEPIIERYAPAAAAGIPTTAPPAYYEPVQRLRYGKATPGHTPDRGWVAYAGCGQSKRGSSVKDTLAWFFWFSGM